jgi:hypothetical protein
MVKNYPLSVKLNAILNYERILRKLGNEVLAKERARARVGCSYRTMLRWVARYHEDERRPDLNLRRRQQGGRIPLLNDDHEQYLYQIALDNPLDGFGRLAVMLSNEFSCLVSVPPVFFPVVSNTTIRKYLLAYGLKRRVARKKAYLIARTIHARLLLAQNFQHHTVEHWNDCVFIDEVAFENSHLGRSFVTRPDGTAFNRQFTVLNRMRTYASVKVFAVCAPGRNYLQFYPFTGYLTSDKFKELWTNCKEQLDAVMDGQNYWLIMDHASNHLANIPWLNAQDLVQVHPWAPKAQDLMVLENVFGWMKGFMHGIGNREGVAHGQQQITDRIFRAYNYLMTNPFNRPKLVNYLPNLAASMPNRMRAVIEAQGQMTRY